MGVTYKILAIWFLLSTGGPVIHSNLHKFSQVICFMACCHWNNTFPPNSRTTQNALIPELHIKKLIKLYKMCAYIHVCANLLSGIWPLR